MRSAGPALKRTRAAGACASRSAARPRGERERGPKGPAAECAKVHAARAAQLHGARAVQARTLQHARRRQAYARGAAARASCPSVGSAAALSVQGTAADPARRTRCGGARGVTSRYSARHVARGASCSSGTRLLRAGQRRHISRPPAYFSFLCSTYLYGVDATCAHPPGSVAAAARRRPLARTSNRGRRWRPHRR